MLILSWAEGVSTVRSSLFLTVAAIMLFVTGFLTKVLAPSFWNYRMWSVSENSDKTIAC